ncbi:hypothetical protein apy_02990 [Aeropyrum pernix]|uniref:ArnR1-like winged-helix domain-containing protein n=1 Tax=Aeropyrum pernix TaxID=56636 RepID=A0A401H837_AERPX|nr:hypothetical protein [Aeropyrum pernix]GBF08574.1 hypothetical protein apy_02990 [Aeropyrum pernix]
MSKESEAIERLLLWHIASVLLKLMEYESKGYNPTISELITASGIFQSLFRTSLNANSKKQAY